MVRTRAWSRVTTLLKRIYTDLKNPASFSSPLKLYRAAKRLLPQIKLKDVTEWLETQKSYTLHRRLCSKFRKRKVVTRGVCYQYQADLVGYSKLKRDNSGNAFVLTVIDCFSRFALAPPLKRKSGDQVAAALTKAFDSMGNPRKFHTDQGKEFYNRNVKEVLRERGVHHFSTYQDIKAQIVERFNPHLERSHSAVHDGQANIALH